MVGFEPTALRLTAERTTVVLHGNKTRRNWTRTSGLLLPKQTRYQASLYAVKLEPTTGFEPAYVFIQH